MKKKPLLQELAKEKIRLAGPHRWTLYGVTFLVWISGTLWLCFNPLWAPASDSLESPWTHWLMEIHGAAAMLFLVMMGSLLTHVARAWASGRNRLSGLSAIVSVGFLALTGWGLYYMGDEGERLIISWGHSVVGVALALLLVLHVIFGRRSR